MPNSLCLSFVVSTAVLVAACATNTTGTAAPTPARTIASAPRDSVESVCVRGDTATLALRSRVTGKRHLQRLFFTSDGGVLDLDTGRPVMDSAQVARSGIRELFRQEAALDERETELARRSGISVPPATACR